MGEGRERSHRRRCVIIVLTAISLLALLGAAALAVDISMLVDYKRELRTATDNAALAACITLSRETSSDPTAATQQAARAFIVENLVGNMVVSPQDVQVTVGHSQQEGDGTYSPVDPAVPWGAFNAVQVTASIAAPTTFATVLGIAESHLAAKATALVPNRELVFLTDFSQSMAHRSVFQGGVKEQIAQNYLYIMSGQAPVAKGPNLHDIWTALPNKPGQSDYYDCGEPTCGPAPGWFFQTLGYGDLDEIQGDIDLPSFTNGYDPRHDPGLLFLSKDTPGTDAWDENTGPAAHLLRMWGYNSDEVRTLINFTDELQWTYAVGCALGLLGWDSGLDPEAYDEDDQPLWAKYYETSVGNGDLVVDIPDDAPHSDEGNEIVLVQPKPQPSTDPDFYGGLDLQWSEYIWSVGKLPPTTQIVVDGEVIAEVPNGVHRCGFGIKSYVNYFIRNRYFGVGYDSMCTALFESQGQLDGPTTLSGVPIQPLQDLKDAIMHLMQAPGIGLQRTHRQGLSSVYAGYSRTAGIA